MSLDVHLTLRGVQHLDSGPHIFVREDGQTKEITRAEWDARYPGREPVMTETASDDDEVYSANITHNLNRMAEEAGIYYPLWRPEEIGVTIARQLIDPLEAGLQLLVSDPHRFEQYNPSNGWGSYDGLVSFVHDYLAACKEYPEAEVYASR